MRGLDISRAVTTEGAFVSIELFISLFIPLRSKDTPPLAANRFDFEGSLSSWTRVTQLALAMIPNLSIAIKFLTVTGIRSNF